MKTTDMDATFNFEEFDFVNYSKVLLPNTNGFDVVGIDQIMRLEADSNYTRVVLKNGNCLFVSWTLKKFEKLLSLPGFFRTHRSHIIHLSFVKGLITKNGWRVTFKDKDSVPVSRKNRQELVKRLISRSMGENNSGDIKFSA